MTEVNLPKAIPIFDTHAHLDFDRFEPDFDGVLERARRAGVEHIVTIGAGSGASSMDRAIAIAERYEWIHATVGIHPHDARMVTPEALEKVRMLAGHHKVVAVGETGLDYHYDRSPRAQQRAAFIDFIQLAQAVEKPLIVHTREADEDTVAILRSEGEDGYEGIIHCFSGTDWLAERALALGFCLSFSGIVTFEAAKAVREVARTMPLDRMLVETDAPYLAPVPMRGKRNEPAFVSFTLRCIAQLRDMDPFELAQVTTENARRVYRIRTKAKGT